MTEWVLDLDCVWSRAGRKRRIRLQLERPRVINGEYAIGLLEIGPLRVPAGKIAGIDPAQVKRLAIRIIREALEGEGARLLDFQGREIDLAAITPLVIEDYSGLERVATSGHTPGTLWPTALECVWAAPAGSETFNLRISEALAARGKFSCAIAGDHPKLGNLVATCPMDQGLRYPIGFALPDFADWHQARILHKDGSLVDFVALAEEIMKT